MAPVQIYFLLRAGLNQRVNPMEKGIPYIIPPSKSVLLVPILWRLICNKSEMLANIRNCHSGHLKS